MTATFIRSLGLVLTIAYGSLIVWTYANQPRTVAEMTGGITASVGAYRIDRASFDDGLRYFHNDQFLEARSAFARADPAKQDAVTQFYIAYSLLRQGWGRVYNDEALLKQAQITLEHAIEVAPNGRIAVSDPNLTLTTSDELRAEIARGLTHDASDLNPFKVLRRRP
jgi:tetratricopeptide (TPR) repeat protein